MLPLTFSHSPSRSFERLGHRIQLAIASPHVQKRQFIEVVPNPDETLDDWQRLLADLEDTHGVRIERLASGRIRIGWRDFTEA